jgi:hypothetical protein
MEASNDLLNEGELKTSYWRIKFDGLSPVRVMINPPCTRQQMMLLNQGASKYEPIAEPFYIEVLPND